MFSCIKKGAFTIATKYLKSYLTVDKITELILAAINSLLGKITKNIDDEKMAKVCTIASKVSELCTRISKAVSDKKITLEEANSIAEAVQDIINKSELTDEMVGEYIDKLAESVKERM